MVNGKYHGKFKQWYDNGMIALEVDYINGKKNGVYKYWLPNGKLETGRKYKADTIINTKIYTGQ
jgi:antitoxin component YwqK of YwqJK toxin-antitoxin module